MFYKKLLGEEIIHDIFDGLLIFKAIHAFLEILGGLSLWAISKQYIFTIVSSLTREELAQDPKDFIANYLVQQAQHFSISSQHFVVFYLLFHGIINGFLVWELYQERLWSYVLGMYIFGIFIAYQIFEFTLTHSLWLILISMLDILIIGLTWHEYRFIKRVRGL